MATFPINGFIGTGATFGPDLEKAIGEGIRGFKAAINSEEKPASTTTTTIANDRSVTRG